MSDHTPGPWRYEADPNYPVLGSMPGPRNYRIWHDVDEPRKQDSTVVAVLWNDLASKAEANARLIAAAPDMLEACQNVAKFGGYLSRNQMNMLTAAIAKATVV